jgi:hypothetical protein
MRFEAFSFGSISIDGTTYGYDVVIDHGRIRKTDSPVFLSKLGKIDHHDGSPLKHFGSSFAARLLSVKLRLIGSTSAVELANKAGAQLPLSTNDVKDKDRLPS